MLASNPGLYHRAAIQSTKVRYCLSPEVTEGQRGARLGWGHGVRAAVRGLLKLPGEGTRVGP